MSACLNCGQPSKFSFCDHVCEQEYIDDQRVIAEEEIVWEDSYYCFGDEYDPS